jgi:hypothetical protein
LAPRYGEARVAEHLTADLRERVLFELVLLGRTETELAADVASDAGDVQAALGDQQRLRDLAEDPGSVPDAPGGVTEATADALEGSPGPAENRVLAR